MHETAESISPQRRDGSTLAGNPPRRPGTAAPGCCPGFAPDKVGQGAGCALAGYFAGQLGRAALFAKVEFALRRDSTPPRVDELAQTGPRVLSTGSIRGMSTEQVRAEAAQPGGDESAVPVIHGWRRGRRWRWRS